MAGRRDEDEEGEKGGEEGELASTEARGAEEVI